MWCVKPTVDKIANAGNTNHQATMIRAVLDHPALTAACTLAGILSTKDQAVASYISKQTAWMLEHAHSNLKVHGNQREKNTMPPRLLYHYQLHHPPGRQPTGKQSFQASVIVLSCLGSRIQHSNVSMVR